MSNGSSYPIVFNLTGSITIDITPTGSTLSNALVQMYCGETLMWQGDVLENTPVDVPTSTCGAQQVQSGVFTLTPPSGSEEGTLQFTCTLDPGGPFSGIVAAWPAPTSSSTINARKR